MRLLSISKYFLQTLRAQKNRALLTMLGIIIGVAAVISVMGVGASAQNLLISQINAMGTNLIGILPGGGDENAPPATLFGIEITTLKQEDALSIENLPNIVAACSYVRGRGTVSYSRVVQDYDFVGVSPSYLNVEDAKLAAGRFFRQDELNNLAKVAVIGSQIKKDLFKNDDPLNKQIKINQTIYQVIGVMEERGTAAFQNQDTQIFIPLTTAQKLMLGINHLAFIRAKVDKTENIEPTIARVKETLRRNHNIKDPAKDDFSVRSTAQALDILGTVTQALKLFLAAVAGISLLVGGIGIMNIMFVTVTERTKEIGLRKAVGAKRRDILVQFLAESAALTLLGGILGILLGVLISFAISVGVKYFGYDWQFIVTFSSVVVSVLMAIAVGLIFGLWPANRASKMQPVDALRK